MHNDSFQLALLSLSFVYYSHLTLFFILPAHSHFCCHLSDMRSSFVLNCLVGLVLISYALGLESTPIRLGHKEPKRVFDEVKKAPQKNPFRDSLVSPPVISRDLVPLVGGIGFAGTYYAEIEVASQTFRVIVVRFLCLGLVCARIVI